MQIEPATLEDVPSLAGLLGELFAQEAELEPNVAAQSEGLRWIIADPSIGRILVLRKAGAITGMVNVLFTVSTALGGRVATLEDLVVRSGSRGQGIGTVLLRAAIELARAEQCLRITLLTDRTNERAIRLYKRHGFALSGMIPLRQILSP